MGFFTRKLSAIPRAISKAARQLWRLPKALLYGIATLVVINLSIIGYCNWRIERASAHEIYADVTLVPANKVGLLLGTSKWLRNGQPNLYFKYRIDAAVELYQAGKIKYILVSGDNRTVYYNEPRDMQRELIKRGVPEAAIYLDYAGFRTLDSVVRCKEIFGQEHFTVISQEFHNRRAIYIAKQKGFGIIGYNAKDVTVHSGFKTMLREKFARVKAFIDLNVLMEQPRFLGEKIVIGT